MKYLFGGLIVVSVLVFVYKQIKSVIDDIRNRRSKKSSAEGAERAGEQSSEEAEKEVKQ